LLVAAVVGVLNTVAVGVLADILTVLAKQLNKLFI
jgi:hypothetical protein